MEPPKMAAAGGGAGGGGDDGLTLLGLWASPFVLRVKLALSLKGLRCEYIEEDLYRKSDRLLGYNPVHKRVPVLLHRGRPVCESRVIVEYIDEAFPAGAGGASNNLLPADPYERATARFWAAFVDDGLMPSWFRSVRAETDADKAEALRETLAAVEALEAGFRDMDRLSGAGGGGAGKTRRPFFGGAAPGYVDVVLGGAVAWLRAAEELYGTRLFDAARSPLLEAWLERFAALDAVRAVAPDVPSLVEYGKMRDAEIAAANK